MIPTALNNSNNPAQTVVSSTIGIASLILEGRALSDDNYILPVNGKKHVLLMPPGYNSATMQQNHVPLINISNKPPAEILLPPNRSVPLTSGDAFKAAVTAVVASNSRTANKLSSSLSIAGTSLTSPSSSSENASSISESSASSSLASSFQSVSSSAISATSSNILDPSMQHFQRIRQKLTQLRQSSPKANRDSFSTVDHGIAVGGPPSFHHNVSLGNPNFTASNTHGCNVSNEILTPSIFGIQQKLIDNNPSVRGSTLNSGSTESGVNLVSESNNYSDTNFGNNSIVGGVESGCSGKSVEYPKLGGCNSSIINFPENSNLFHAIQSFATNCLWVSPRSLRRSIDDWDNSAINNDGESEAQIAFNSTTNSNYYMNNFNSCLGITSSTMSSRLDSNEKCKIINTNNSSNICNDKREDKVRAYPKQGPHCDQFLKNIGLTSNKGQQIEFEEHICDMANLNEICFYWQVHCRQLEVMLSRSDPICIEVYLGPENQEILMEQWIIEKTDSPTTPSMTIQALCNAIRSQLYFSQITAWSDSIKNMNPFDKEITNNPRIKSSHTTLHNNISHFETDLVPPITISSDLSTTKKPRLDIFYRIKPYDSTASFNAKPNIHNFPNVLITGNSAISVCLKSLPRQQGGIPKIAEITNKSLTQATNLNNLKQQLNSFDESQTLAQFCPMLLDDNLNVPCTEKGKHKCCYDEEDGISSDTLGECSGNSSSSGSAEIEESRNPLNMSHREKQLMKYRKRMMKRDKKKTVTNTNIIENINVQEPINYKTITPSISTSNQNKLRNDIAGCEEPCKNRDENKLCLLDGKAQIDEIHMLQHQQEFGSINSIGLPLYQPNTNSISESVQTQHIEMISIGTQTTDFILLPCCDKCDIEMSAVCFKCGISENKKSFLNINTHYKGYKCCSEKKNSSEGKLEKGELLLQAIQRVPKIKTENTSDDNHSFNLLFPNSIKTSCDNYIAKTNTSTFSLNDCQLCKRQKTQHTYKQNKNSNFLNYENPKLKSGSQVRHQNIHQNENLASILKKGNERNCNCSPVSLTVRMDDIKGENSKIVTPSSERNCNCSPVSLTVPMDDIKRENSKIVTPSSYPISPLIIDTNNFNSHVVSRPSTYKTNNIQFETPNSKQIYRQQIHKIKEANEVSKTIPVLQVIHNMKGEVIETTKTLPKINLANAFCGYNQAIPTPISISTSPTPITINQQNSSISLPDFVKIDKSLNNVSASEIPVQKSNSAPSLPNSPSLSPRFIKQAAIYKRRSRHLSDRSDRSSLGSDDLSDEDLEGLYPSPLTSPIKSKFFTKKSVFTRRPLLGNLEENLFQKRFVPKVNVTGFKVLLGASGQFCPTQLTIPAASYFYELDGEILSTPYICEIRLSRKGYTIPRFGTIQATLLNPFGTVVRMFVIPYDFRDMPPMNQTFIRQRILAVDPDSLSFYESSSSNNNKNLNIENNNNKNTNDDHNNKYSNYSNYNNNNNTNNNNDKMNKNNFRTNDSNNNNRNNNNDNKNNNNNNNINKNNNNSNINNNKNDNNIYFNNIKLNNNSDNFENSVPHCSKEHLSSLRYSIHLRFQTSRSGRLALHTDIKFLISRRTDCDTAAAHAKGAIESPNELRIVTITPEKPKYSARQEPPNSNKI